ncbi:MAG: DEAD/DEAH box helicase, partial [Ktedonobacteraceae bacterium]
VGAGRHEYGAPITVASIQTIARPEHLQALPRYGYKLLIIDEAHHACASGYRAVLNALSDAFTLGVTATPDRLDEQRIESIFGKAVYRASLLDMIEQGYLCDLRSIAVKTQTSLDNMRLKAEDYQVEELVGRIDVPERNQQIVDAYLRYAPNRPALCFAATIEHARHLAETFTANGIPAAAVSGETALRERTRLLHDYDRGVIRVLCNCGVLTEGYDSPHTSCIILARPTRSRALLVQMIGRGTRLAPGKQDCLILDITDNCLSHHLEPQTSGAAIDVVLADSESVKEFCQRTRQEQGKEEREKQQRILVVDRRTQDMAVNILATLDWQQQPDGGYALLLGPLKHRIALIPSHDQAGRYEVWAQLAPTFTQQRWLEAAPLDWAQQFAEHQSRILLADPGKTILLDRRASWRQRPVDPAGKQAQLLRKLHLPITEGMTQGEASDRLTRHFTEQDRRKQARETHNKSRKPEQRK